MEPLLLKSKCFIFHNIFKSLTISKASKGACVELRVNAIYLTETIKQLKLLHCDVYSEYYYTYNIKHAEKQVHVYAAPLPKAERQAIARILQ